MRACRRVSFNKIPPAFFFCQLLLLMASARGKQASIQNDYDEWWWRTVRWWITTDCAKMQAKENLAIAAASLPDTSLSLNPCTSFGSANAPPFDDDGDDVRWLVVISFRGLQCNWDGTPQRECTALQIKCKRIFSLFLLYGKQALHIPSAYFSASYSSSAYFQELTHGSIYHTQKGLENSVGWKALATTMTTTTTRQAPVRPSFCDRVFVRFVHKSAVWC